jgi:hypothetical protein
MFELPRYYTEGLQISIKIKDASNSKTDLAADEVITLRGLVTFQRALKHLSSDDCFTVHSQDRLVFTKIPWYEYYF